jgi:hypothetical protein
MPRRNRDTQAEAGERTMESWIWDYVNPIDADRLAREWNAAQPHHYVAIEGFLRPEFAAQVAASYPSFEQALPLGKHFRWVNEKVKVQITDVEQFPAPIRTLHEILAAPEFLELLARVTGIPRLVADPTLAGGGMHVMGPGGLLGAHADFNMLEEAKLHRRLNLLVYTSREWKDGWGGEFDLWDEHVKVRQASILPLPNRCVVFNTTDTSFHSVAAIRAPVGVTRNSFATYYYTEEPPAHWIGRFHNTIYKPLPGEWWKNVAVPLEGLQRRGAWLAAGAYDAARRRLRRLVGRS